MGSHRVRHNLSDLACTWPFRIISKTYCCGLNTCVPLNSCQKPIFQGDGNRRWCLCPHEWDSGNHKKGARSPLGHSAMWGHHAICKLAEGSHLHLLAGSLHLGLSASRTMRNKYLFIQFSSVAQSYLTLCHPIDCKVRPPCPSPTPGVYSNSCPLSQWCHPANSSSVVSFSSCPQSFPASGSFQVSQLFASGGKIIGVSASTIVLPMNIQDWFPLGWTGWISLQSKGLSRVFSNTTV